MFLNLFRAQRGAKSALIDAEGLCLELEIKSLCVERNGQEK